MTYPYPGLFAIDPQDPMNVASEAEVTIFDPADALRVPLALTDSEGLSIPNPMMTNDKGFVGVFYSELDEVGWSAGELVGLVQSYQGIKRQAQVAAESAAGSLTASVEASDAALLAQQAAEQAAQMIGAPADEVIGSLLGTAGSDTQTTADGRYSKRGENYIYVPDYAPTDGSDATAGIQAAANLAAGFGHILDFGTSEHQYWVAGVVELGGRTVLTGKGAVLYKRDSALESSYAIFCTRSHGVAAYGAGGSSIRVNNLRFKGNFPNRPACALSAHHSDDVQFHGCDFEEMAGTGHVIDLGGCRDTLFRDCRFIGATAVNSRAECIQADLSIRSGISVTDDPGSYSGLPSVRVTVDNCKFLPLIKDGVDYPAPVPFGSHAEWEGRWFEGMKFINNTVVNGRVHTGTDPVGLIHFSCVKGLTVRGNTFVNTLTSTGRVISITPATTGVLAGADPNATTNPTGTFTQPMRSSGIDVSDNKFTGFFSTVYKVIHMASCDDVSVTVNKWDGCGSMYDIRDTVGFTAYGNIFRKPSATIAAQVVNLNKVTRIAASNEVIDVAGVASITDIVYISNNSAGGLFTNSTIAGKGTDGIRQAVGSTLVTTGNVLI